MISNLVGLLACREARKSAMIFAMKQLLILLLFSILPPFVVAEPRAAQLTGVVDNGTLMMDMGRSVYVCSPYGVRTLEALREETMLAGECRQQIARFYARQPLQAQFAHRELKRFQFYRIEQKEAGCVLYARGRLSYAERLLQEGLAIVAPGFDDREWGFRFEQAEQGAKELKRGIWGDPLWAKCAAALVK